jgi:hypothetical protein
MPTVTPFDILSSAHELVASGWCQGATARDRQGDEVDPRSGEACAWSAAGAIVATRRTRGDSPVRGHGGDIEAFIAANGALAGSLSTAPDEWNDAPGRTREQVLQAFNRSTALLEAPLLETSRS